MPTQILKVTTDVRRDLLASAAMFKTEAAVVWEYVVNSLQYVERGVPPRVQVTIKPRAKEVEISDNGRGMSSEELQHYFRMHGENMDRVRGKAGRGKFGTGKSAAFGIGRSFRIDTRRGGLRNVVELSREMIDRSGGDEIPLNWRVRNEVVQTSSGTTVTIADIILPRLNAAPVVEYIERHLQAFRALGAAVAVNDHLCEYREPVVSETLHFRPTPQQATVLGDVELTIKVAQAPEAPRDCRRLHLLREWSHDQSHTTSVST